MIELPGYSIAEQIYTGTRTLVHRGIRELDQTPVVLKLMRNQYPSFSELVQFRNQYTIARNIDLPGIIKPYSLETYRNGYALVMQDFGGISLKEWKDKGESFQFLDDFLYIAIQLATILDKLHRDRVIHKDIKPANILINPDTKQVKLIDFSIASLLPRETQVLQNPNVLEGTLAYISPEQTGRMNRGIDYRTDFYSLGITFFELLTGHLPFTSNDPMELVHCHIAKIPPSVYDLNPKIPPVLSLIVGKLMAKNAENRYQSALGLKHDLEICWQKWQQTSEIASFNLGQRDVCDRFLIPEKLYGRDTEVQTLLAAFDRIAGNSQSYISNASNSKSNIEMVLVAGFSGIGKTAVVNEVHKPIVRQRGYFIEGKFDQFQRNVPFSAFVQAFRDLMGQLLAESDAQLAQWKTKILDAVGENGQVIIEVIPELENIIGAQPPVTELSGIAAQNRFNLLFEKFICVFTSIEHPLVIFIDDLQWADSASLKLMQLLMSESEAQSLLLIGAYRDNEVSPAHPFILTVDEIKKAGATVNTITLQPLTQADINHLVADTLSCDRTLAEPLTNLVYQKTKGNPFFATQLLKSLHEDGLITFNFEFRYWQCDLTKVKALTIADDVVEFMVAQLQKLPQATQEVLKLAACIGNQFDLNTLAIVLQKSPEETASDLWQSLREGFILPTAEIYKFYQGEGERELSERLLINNYQIPHYKFVHDRIQQAAYSLIPELHKQATHLKIGQLLLLNTPPEAQEEKIFEIVNQLNIGVGLIRDHIEQERLIQLNLSAAHKAKTATAYAAAVNYCMVGINLLDSSSWSEQYDLTLALYTTATEVSYLNGEFQQMEQFAELILKQAKTLLDKVKVYETQIVARIVQRKQPEAIKIALSILTLLGIELPESPADSDFNLGLSEVYTNLQNRNIPDLIELPVMANANYQAAMRILSSIISAAYVSAPSLLPLIVFKMVNLSLEFGNSPHSIMGYCMHGVILCAGLGNIEEGYQFGKLGLTLLEKNNAQEFGAKVGDLFFGLTNHWQENLNTSISNLKQAYCTGLEIGDLEFAGYCISKYGFYSFWTGKELGWLEQEMSTYCKALGQLKQLVPQNYLNSYWQAVLNLLGQSENPCNFIGTAYNEQVMLPQYLQDNDFTGIAYLSICKTAILYLFGEQVKAQESAELAEKYLGGVSGTVCIPVFYFYDSLVRLAQLSNADVSQVNEILEKVSANQKKIETWAKHAPTNYWHKFYLVEAEQNRLQGKHLEAIELYDRAIALAKENEYVNEEALANELAAKFYLEWGKEKIAQTYMTEAYYAYARWGAKTKVMDLEKCYPQLLTPLLNQKINLDSTLSSLTVGTVVTSSFGKSSIFDLEAVMKAAQAISTEIELEKLLSSLMQVVIENAGAQKVSLILKQDNDWLIEAEAKRINQTEEIIAIAPVPGMPIESSQEIPQSLIYNVLRTQEILVFDDATVPTQFAGDRYIIKHQPKSILCLPICDRGHIIGILYLENNITTGVFSRDRVQILKLLAAQAAISLENARLYQQVAAYSHNLETEVNRKTQALQVEIKERHQAEIALREQTQHLEATLQKLKQTQSQLIQTEKMSSLGQLVAGVAHEINNPVNFIHGNLSYVSEYTHNLLELVQLYQENHPDSSPEIQEKITAIDLEFVNEDLPKVLESMETGTERIKEIVRSLRNFSRLDESEIKLVDIHQGIDSTLTILQNRLRGTAEHPEIKVIKEYGELPLLKCYPGLLNQVFMNIISNAIDALEEIGNRELEQFSTVVEVRQGIAATPSIRIRTELTDANQILIIIGDNGYGISQEIQQRLFDPFFTTKPVGKGTGLGLSISYQIIVEKHGGTIEVNSGLGEGTEFAIALPLQV